jgi:hypothetical protein
LKENFDRFNFAIYKEKEMADFRRLFTALALVALFVGLACAQVNSPSSMSCTTTSTVTPTVRAEGFTELVGDIVLNCSGGNALANGTAIPQANITVFLNTQVTSRVMNASSNNASEALLLIDEPGASILGVGGYGPTVPQTVCPYPLGGFSSTGASCVEYVGYSTVAGAPAAGGVPVQTYNGTTPTAPGWNVFQGVVSGNSVTFYGVPILPPVTNGSRVFRITNIRANANGISGGGPTPGSITGSVSISPSNAFTINQPLNTLAFVQQGLTSSLRSTSNGSYSTPGLAQCNTNNGAGSNSGNGVGIALLQFTENFPTAFKTRSALVNGNTLPLSAFTGQNIPGQVYNSESGFTVSTITGSGTIAGVADWGTRLKAVFTNIPSGVSILVSTTNLSNITTTATTTNGSPTATMLVSETAADANGFLPAATATVTYTSGGAAYAPATNLGGGTWMAVWEVTQNNYTTNQSLNFGVYVQYSGGAGSGTPTPGAMSVAMSLAPNPTNGAFSATSATNPASVNIVPRFADTSSAKTLANINICQTVLLFPYVTTAVGFDTGLAISNTTQDPMNDTVQTGSCTLSWYQAGTAGTNPAATTTPAIPGGTSYTTLASATTNAGQNFTGYMFAVCNFEWAHGYAAITDVGARGIFASYLPLVVGTGTGSRNNPETLMH